MHTSNDDEPATSKREPAWRRYLRMIRTDSAADFNDELRDHIESTVEALVARGSSAEEARAEAHRRFGDVGRVRGEVRQLDVRHARRGKMIAALGTVWYDLRHAARGLRRSPAFTIVAVLSIALGVAANTTIFSVVNALLLRPIPGTHADGLKRLYVNRHSPFDWRDLSWYRAHARSFDYIIGERYGAMAFRRAPGADAARIHTSYTTQGFFPALGVRTAVGRTFDVDDANATSDAAVAVLSNAFWQRQFEGDSSVIGRRILLGDHALTVVGVLAPDFRSSVMSWVPDVLLPFAAAPMLTGQRLEDFGGSFYTTARLRSGVSVDVGQIELRALMAELSTTDKERYEGMTVRLDEVRGVNAEERQAVTAGSAFLLAMVAMVLLIACANVANLLLGRVAARRTEMGVRLAIGASRARLVRQLLTESLLLAAAGGAAGFAAAWILTRVIPAALPAEAGIDAAFFSPDAHVVLFTGLLCLATTLLFGVAPALRAASPNLVGLLKGDASPGVRRRRRGALIAGQSAMCVLLLAVASLFLRSLARSSMVDPGFRADGIVDVTIDLSLASRAIEKQSAFSAIQRSASDMPGTQSAALAAVVPLSGSNMETRVLPEGAVVASRRDAPMVYFNIVSPRFFETLQTPVLRGREFLASDAANAPRVAVVNETGAKRLWPSGDAVGKRFHWGSIDGELYEVVGVARDANYVMPGETPKATVYLPVAQQDRGELTLQLRTSADLPSVRRAVWDMLRTVAPTLPPPPVVRMSDDMAITLLPVRAGAVLLGVFGGIALVLATAGIYGVAAYSVASRTREIGVRAALGATNGRLLNMVLWENGRRVMLGAVVGLVLTVGVATGLSRVLYGVQALDAAVLGGVTALIAAVAVLAALPPALRAARADPVTAMRAE